MLRRIALLLPFLLSMTVSVTAQNLMLGPWRFGASGQLTIGTCPTNTTNAPGGTFWGGNQRQPVLKAHSVALEDQNPMSRCGIWNGAESRFTVGPADTLIELECVLYGKRVLEGVPGRITVTGWADIIDSTPRSRAALRCEPYPLPLLTTVGSDRVHATKKKTVCLQRNDKYEVEGILHVEAQIERNGRPGDHAEADFSVDDGSGLPFGLMLIIQPRGPCKPD